MNMNDKADDRPSQSISSETGGDQSPPSAEPNRSLRLVLEALLLGSVFARDFFDKSPSRTRRSPAPRRRPPIDVPVEALAGPATLPAQPPSEVSKAVQSTGREADRDLNIYSKAKLAKKERTATAIVASAFALAMSGGVGFLIAYWTGGNNLVLGSTLAVFLGGFGFALVLYSHSLMSQKEATEAREVLPSSQVEREAFRKNLCASAGEVKRRSLLMWMGAAFMGLFASIVLSLMRSLGMSPYPALFNTVWKSGEQLMMADGTPVTVNSLQTGSAITVFPEGRIGSEDGQTMLIRVPEHLLRLPGERAHWAPMGYVAYSRVCTHAGCPVALFESSNNILLCPCHQSTFDVLRAAKPTGGPAARPLPQLPLYVDGNGNLRAGGGFSAPPGPGFWGTT